MQFESKNCIPSIKEEVANGRRVGVKSTGLVNGGVNESDFLCILLFALPA